jgi:two-component system response regulator AtoC
MKKKVEATVIMMSAYGNVDTAVEAMKLGAYDYISKPFKPDEILLTLKKAEEREQLRKENVLLREEVQRKYNFSNLIGKSPQMLKIFDMSRDVFSGLFATKFTSLILIGFISTFS